MPSFKSIGRVSVPLDDFSAKQLGYDTVQDWLKANDTYGVYAKEIPTKVEVNTEPEIVKVIKTPIVNPVSKLVTKPSIKPVIKTKSKGGKK